MCVSHSRSLHQNTGYYLKHKTKRVIIHSSIAWRNSLVHSLRRSAGRFEQFDYCTWRWWLGLAWRTSNAIIFHFECPSAILCTLCISCQVQWKQSFFFHNSCITFDEQNENHGILLVILVLLRGWYFNKKFLLFRKLFMQILALSLNGKRAIWTMWYGWCCAVLPGALSLNEWTSWIHLNDEATNKQ